MNCHKYPPMLHNFHNLNYKTKSILSKVIISAIEIHTMQIKTRHWTSIDTELHDTGFISATHFPQ